MGVPDVAATEQVNLREAGLEVQLSDQLRELRDRLVGAFGDLEVLGFRGELTVITAPGRLLDVLAFSRDQPDVRCQYLMDLSGVHWPGGVIRDDTQETTGWPAYEYEREGRIELDYILYSLTHNHRFRVRTSVPDVDPSVPSAVGLWGAANVMEREVYDFLGVHFEGHSNLTRILMPEEWDGHPHRKDYPLGGVEIAYQGATIPPPSERKY